MKNNYLSTKSITLFILGFLFLSTAAQAQLLNKENLSFGLSYGANQVLGDKVAVGKGNFSPQNIQVDARYLFNEVIGLSGHYAYSGFSQNSGTDAYGFHRVVLEAIVNLNVGEAFNSNNFNLYAHAGGGPSISSRNKDKMLVFMGGLTPEYRISDKWAVKGDVSYVNYTKQNYDFTGTYIDKKHDSSNLLNYSIGLQFYIGAGEGRSARYY